MPMEAYAGAVKWDERILKMHRAGRIAVNGIDHILFRISRKEAVR